MFALRIPSRRGAATVEFAVVLPVLLLFVLGILEIGRLVMVAQVSTNAAREGARYAAQGTADTVAIDAYVRNYLSAAGMRNTDQTAVVAVAVELDTGGAAGWQPVTNPGAVTAGTPLRVTVSVNFSKQSWLPTQFVVGPNTQVRGVTIMRKE